MGGIALASRALHEAAENCEVLRKCSFSIRGKKLLLFDDTRAALYEASRKIEREGELSELLDVITRALRHSSVSSLRFGDHRVQDIFDLMQSLPPLSGVSSLTFERVDFTGLPAAEFHQFVFAFGTT